MSALRSTTAVLGTDEIRGLVADSNNPNKALVFKVGRTTGGTHSELNLVHPSIRMECVFEVTPKTVVAKMLLVVAPDT